jgi:hypothetical protein
MIGVSCEMAVLRGSQIVRVDVTPVELAAA